MIWPTSVELDGVAVPLAGVLADVTIRHGRSDVDSQPIASSALLTLEPVTRVLTAGFTVGRSIRILAGDDPPIVGTFLTGTRTVGASMPRFTGTVTDAELDDDRLTLTAIGPLATAMRVTLDLTGWILEPWSARCARVFAEVGIPANVEPDPAFDPLLEVPAVDPASPMRLDTYLSSLANAVGAAICDGPDGVVVCQAIGARATRAASLIRLDPARVGYTPVWVQTYEVVNDVTVQYGLDAAIVSVRVTDDASAGEYGERATAIEQTRLHDAGAAAARARTALSRRAYPRWVIPNAPLLEPVWLSVGDRVEITGMPASAPAPSWTPLLEGWTDTIRGPDWTLELALSDPLLSGLALTWAGVGAGAPLAWSAVDPATAWYEAVELEALAA